VRIKQLERIDKLERVVLNMKVNAEISGYEYTDADITDAHRYLVPSLLRILDTHFPQRSDSKSRIFDLGCGNGVIASTLSKRGYEVTGVDPSTTGIEQANHNYPELTLEVGSAYEPLADRFGQFSIVISLEVIEHVYSPRDFARTLFQLTEPGGAAIVSTPFHGYAKNLAIALLGKMDQHFTALWDHGHIKFWSVRTLSTLLEEAGFTIEQDVRIGRIAMFARSMMLLARRPNST
jgi:2-polyprenyl-3-methyl-5-hydroxy-6-metoxy-1,4-benzoquinol methylase